MRKMEKKKKGSSKKMTTISMKMKRTREKVPLTNETTSRKI